MDRKLRASGGRAEFGPSFPRDRLFTDGLRAFLWRAERALCRAASAGRRRRRRVERSHFGRSRDGGGLVLTERRLSPGRFGIGRRRRDGFAGRRRAPAISSVTLDNHLPVAKAGIAAGGEHADEDDFEPIATQGALTVRGGYGESRRLSAGYGD